MSDSPEPDSWCWEVAADPDGISALAPAWDQFVRDRGLPFIAGALWARCFWEAFGNPSQALAIHAARRDGRLVAILPMVRGAQGLLRRWSPVANFHSPPLVFAAERPPAAAAAAILDRLLESADVVELGIVRPADEMCAALAEAARARHLTVVKEAAGSDASLELHGPWEAFRRSLSRNLEQSTARHHRQLQRLGKLSFEEITGGERLPVVLAECFRLEAAGWKADHGSPILAAEDTLRFYTDLAQGAAAAGELAVYVLRLDDAPVAFEYCARAGRRIDMLKISYAPHLARYSPGNVLRYLILRTEIERGAVAIYHMGHASDWKLRWANRTELLFRVRMYGPGPRARLACHAAQLRLALKRCGPLRAAIRWARNVRTAAPRGRAAVPSIQRTDA